MHFCNFPALDVTDRNFIVRLATSLNDESEDPNVLFSSIMLISDGGLRESSEGSVRSGYELGESC